MTIPSTTCPLVLEEWEDSRQPIAEWVRLKDFRAAPSCQCVSIGFLIQDDDEKKVLAPNMANVTDVEDIQMSGAITIPSRSIKRIVRLEETD